MYDFFRKNRTSAMGKLFYTPFQRTQCRFAGMELLFCQFRVTESKIAFHARVPRRALEWGSAWKVRGKSAPSTLVCPTGHSSRGERGR